MLALVAVGSGEAVGENAAFEIAAKIELEAGTSSENTIDSIISSVESLDLDLPTRLDVFSDDL